MMLDLGRLADLLSPRKSAERPLTLEEEKRLYEESLKYLTFTMEDSIRIAKLINWIPGNEFEWPNNMCGPLAIIQLIGPGLLPESTRVADFWLLDPRANQRLLEKTFPRDKYEWFETKMPLADFDFGTTPLFPGDFVYTFGGSFEHILAVSRIDDQGRVFAVTNLLTGGKYKNYDEVVIREVMLYDPINPGIGQFFDWKYGKDRNKLGVTGTAGFAYWRRSVGNGAGPEPSSDGEFGGQLETLLSGGGEWHVSIRDISGVGDRDIFTKGENSIIHPASVIKLPIAMVFFEWAARQGVTDMAAFLRRGPGSGRSYEQLLRAMLVNSEEAATATLTDWLDKKISGGMTPVLRGWGMEKTTVRPRQTTAHEMTGLWESLYRGKLVTTEARGKILTWLGEYTDGDRSRLGSIKYKLKLPPGWKVSVWNKRGSIAGGIVVVADAAIVEFISPTNVRKTYVIEFFGYPGGGATYENLDLTIERAAELFTTAVVAGKV